jgi:adenine-specific DNA-methyltransferase
MKVLCDEIFGRKCFVANVVWQKRYSSDARVALGDAHEHILCYALNPDRFKAVRNLLPLGEAQTSQFRNPANDPRGPWKADNFTAAGFRPNQMYEIQIPSGRLVKPPAGRCWRVTREGFDRFTFDKRMYYGPDGNSTPSLKRFLAEMQGLTPWSWWPHTEVGHSQEAKKESHDLFGTSESFATPKPERLINRILTIASDPGDIVLDSFAGSGTTGAVAHKMGRRWIMIELGEHCHTHIIPRLTKVIDGTDPGGVTEACNWKGGGGFRYYSLAPSLLQEDTFGNWVISKEYNSAMLAEAVCKLEGFHYAPSDEYYWQHGHSTESDYIFVTTQTLSREQLQKLNDEVGPNRSLLVCCGAYRTKKLDDFPQLTVKKIPKAVIQKCEWGKDDYSLEIKALPDPRPAESIPVDPVLADLPKNKRKARKALGGQPTLFDLEGDS